MTIELLRELLFWSAVIHICLLAWWAIIFIFAHDLIYRLHSRWFNIAADRFDAIHYAGMAFYKISIFLFVIVPYLALMIVSP